MIEARFDDLTAGRRAVVPARRAGGRGRGSTARRGRRASWRRRRRRPNAACGSPGSSPTRRRPGLDPELAVRVRAPDDPFAELPLAWFALFERAEDAAAARTAPPRRPATSGESPWRPSVDRGGVRRGHRADPGAHRRRRHVPGEPHDPAARGGRGRRARPLPGPRACAQRGALLRATSIVGRYRVLSASPELFFRLDGRRITTRPMKGTAPRGRWLAEDDDDRGRASSRRRRTARRTR